MDATQTRYGVVDAEQARTMSGRQVLQAIVDGALPQAPISRTLGFRLVAVGEGSAAFEGDTGEHLLNPMGTVHGGWALTLIDSAAGCAAYSLLPAGTGYTTIETKGNFSRPILAGSGRVRCEARVVAQGKRVLSCECRLHDAQGRVLAHGTSTLMVLTP